MSRGLRVTLFSTAVLVIAVIVVSYPLPTRGIPEWRLQVQDSAGQQVAARVEVHQEWLEPIAEGVIHTEIRETDSTGAVVFPPRSLRFRLISGTVPANPSARVWICWRDQFGDLNWDGLYPGPPKLIPLRQGFCPYD